MCEVKKKKRKIYQPQHIHHFFLFCKWHDNEIFPPSACFFLVFFISLIHLVFHLNWFVGLGECRCSGSSTRNLGWRPTKTTVNALTVLNWTMILKGCHISCFSNPFTHRLYALHAPPQAPIPAPAKTHKTLRFVLVLYPLATSQIGDRPETRHRF